jgi:hypothetical protein
MVRRLVTGNQPHLVLGRVRPNPLIWAGSGPFQKKIKRTNIFLIFVISPLFLCFV